MKKNILLVSLAVIFSMNMAACGKEEPQEAALTAETETQLVIQVDTEEPKSEETEPENSNDKKFECLPEIQEASIDSGKLQIDDMVFTIGAPVQEIFDELEKSECEYEYDYTPNAIVAKNEGVQLTFKKNGNNYIYFYVYNDADETSELKDCRIVFANAIGNDIENAYYAGKITAGDSYDDIVEYLVGYEIVDEKSDNVDQEYIVNYRMRYASDEAHGAIHSLQLTFDSNTSTAFF